MVGAARWPWLRDEYTILRPLAHPEMLEVADKNYRVRAAGETTTAFMPGDWLPLPAPRAQLEVAVQLAALDRGAAGGAVFRFVPVH